MLLAQKEITASVVSNRSQRLGRALMMGIAPLTACGMATINQIAPGRAILGIGTGNLSLKLLELIPGPDTDPAVLAGMEASLAATRFAPLGAIRWQVVPLMLPARSDSNYDPDKNRATLANAKAIGENSQAAAAKAK